MRLRSVLASAYPDYWTRFIYCSPVTAAGNGARAVGCARLIKRGCRAHANQPGAQRV
jgi:hypothetical protein